MIKQSAERKYQICTNCIMDTSDSKLKFDEQGKCAQCLNFELNVKPSWDTELEGQANLNKIKNTIKKDSSSSDFDCIIGLSGGLDSSYVSYIAAKKMGLKPLLFHVDAGWNTDQAVSNIEKIVNGLGLDLYTDVANWDEVKRLQVAFLKSGIPDQDLVQDSIFFSGLYKFARKYKIKNIITGSNYSTEVCREPISWGSYLGIDKTLFNDIWSKHGSGKIKNLKIIDILKYKILYKTLGMKIHYPLNYIPFLKVNAEKELNILYGWKPFKHKHHESRFTRFFEDYWLPRRFGFDRRRAHFSSLIMTGQMSREDALARISRPEMSEEFLEKEFSYVANKLDLEKTELKSLFELPKKTFKDYKNKYWIIKLGTKFLKKFGTEKRYL